MSLKSRLLILIALLACAPGCDQLNPAPKPKPGPMVIPQPPVQPQLPPPEPEPQPEPQPQPEAQPAPMPAAPQPVSSDLRPEFTWLERSWSEGNGGIRFVVKFQLVQPTDIPMRVVLRDRKLTPVYLKVGREGNVAGVDQFIPKVNSSFAPYDATVQYYLVQDDSWNNVVSFQELPRK